MAAPVVSGPLAVDAERSGTLSFDQSDGTTLRELPGALRFTTADGPVTAAGVLVARSAGGRGAVLTLATSRRERRAEVRLAPDASGAVTMRARRASVVVRGC